MKAILPRHLYDKNKKYYLELKNFSVPNISDYWAFHSAEHVEVRFSDKEACVDISGFFNPVQIGTFHYYKDECRQKLQKIWKQMETHINKIMACSSPHSPSNLYTYGEAYRCVYAMEKVIAYDANPYRMNFSKFKNLMFKDIDEMKKERFLKNFSLTDSEIQKFHAYNVIRECVDLSQALYHLEIGGGFGLLAAISAYYGKAKIITVDLPLVSLIASVFLCSVFPDAKILLPNEVGNSSVDADNHDFIFLAPSQTHLIPDNSVNLITNTFSMQEMSRESVGDYFKLIKRVSRDNAVFLCLNRVEKCPDNHKKPTRFSEYPWDTLDSEEIFFEIDRLIRLTQLDPCFIKVVKIKK